MKRLRSGLAALMLLAGLVASGPIAAVQIEVDAQRSSPMPAVMRPGIFTFKPEPPAEALQDWLDQVRPGVVEVDIGGPVFQQASDAADAVRRARALLPMLRRIRAAGGAPVLAITRLPLWLSSRPNATDAVAGDVVPKGSVVAPRDGGAWSDLVTAVVAELKQGLGGSPDYKIGWEPDQSAWQGSEADFFNFYRDTVRGVRRADAQARVGGPSVSALYNGKGGEGAPPMIPRFLRYCADTPLPDLGLKRLPVDFLIWHQFGTDAVLAWDLAARQARAWLRDAGYPERTELFIGEWSSWSAWPQPQSPEHDQPALAAYIVASLAAMDTAGIGRAAFTSLTEQREVEGQPFIGSFGVYTNQFVRKPAFWAFNAVSRLGGARVAARSSDPLVAVIAGRPSAGEVALVVAASSPQPKALQRSFVAKALAAGAGFDELRRALDGRQLERLTFGEASPDEVRGNEALRQALGKAAAEVVPLARRSAAQRGRSHSVVIELSGFDGSSAELWRIDSRHANAFSLRERITGHLQQRLAQEKQSLPQGLLRRFEERGYRGDQIEAFKQVMNSRDRERALAGRAPQDRTAVRALADESQAFISERLWAVGQEINAWPELGFKADERALRLRDRRLEFEMEDDSVVLVRIMNR
ncbi:GH39 family glycosyl hydrolase [Aquabacterium sp. J223]|uniref:GH39 family glycosyl hydrolase n=1 Tax=Aquabacterium sp. J223 TaxID=2898431 RepID=UPI0021AD9578|nr:hypothetical protein [Aquabacterium sp. J223]UUX94791.1 hypothetical protein LRS07_16115 [Aquabacterium sp. J223]